MLDIQPHTRYAVRKDDTVAVDVDTVYSTNTGDVVRVYGPNWPDYKHRLASGRFVTTDQHVTGTQVELASGFLSCRSSNPDPTSIDYATIEGALVPPIVSINDVSSLSDTTATNRAKAAIASKIRSELTKFQGGSFLGELTETIRMLKHPVRSLRKGYDDYYQACKHRARRARRQDISQIISDTWLEYNFGWVPLISDINDLSSAINEMGARNVFSIVKASGSEDEVISEQTYLKNYSYGMQFEYDQVELGKVSRKYKACVKLDLPSSTLSLYGVDSSNFVPTVWELIPYSFAVDYFTNIGDTINAFCLPNGSVRWIETVLVKELTVKQSGFRYKPPNAYWSGFVSGGTCTTTTRDIQRGEYSGSIVPDFQFRLPGLSSRKWLNIGALANLRRL